MNYVILDMEWDSAYHKLHKRFVNQILQIGAVKLDEKFNLIDIFDVTIKSPISKRVSRRFTELTGITKEMMLDTIKYLNTLDIQGIKIHMLHIIKDTALEVLFKKEKFHILTREEYVDIVCDQLELLNEEIVINRITGDPKADELIEPNWLIKKFGVLNEIDKEMAKRNSYQGIKIK